MIAPGAISAPGVSSRTLFQDQLVLITPPAHPLARQAYIEASDLADQEYLTYSRDRQPGFEYDRFIRPAGVSPQYVQVVEWTDTIVELIAANFGVSILSKWALQRSIQNGLVSAIPPGKRGLPLTWSILSRTQDRQREPVQLMQQILIQWFGKNA